ncbi:Rz1-like lysis system protein LysC [Escherichia coli]|uniref:Rz1-like lysis system protein LysC n=1 Tax=Escherichia coli TaxID=562 RepID=UPI001BDC2074
MILLCLLTLSGCGNAPRSPEVQLTVSGCPQVTPCRLEQAAPRTNGDLNALLDETEAAWAVCADKVDMIIACQERNSEQTTIPAPRPQ